MSPVSAGASCLQKVKGACGRVLRVLGAGVEASEEVGRNLLSSAMPIPTSMRSHAIDTILVVASC